jgi:hypothetical protein
MKNSDQMEASGGGYATRNPIPDPADHLHGFQYQEAVDAYVAEHGAVPHDGLAKQQAKEEWVQSVKAEYLVAEEMEAAGGYTAWAEKQATQDEEVQHSIEQQVKDAVYTWALVNAPNVIAEARKLVAS